MAMNATASTIPMAINTLLLSYIPMISPATATMKLTNLTPEYVVDLPSSSFISFFRSSNCSLYFSIRSNTLSFLVLSTMFEYSIYYI